MKIFRIHESSFGLEYSTLVERATKKPARRPQQQQRCRCSCDVIDAGKFSLSCVGYEDVPVKAKQSMSSSLAKPKIHKAGKFSPAEHVWYCKAPLRKHSLENLLSEISKKTDLANIYTSHFFASHFCDYPEGIWA